ncbi:putative F-box protein At5g42430, partial [Arabidopsis lyrata subsp. lyrata]|uniref:putative F-box protein At5g42430 n=1 Tax=Arabidopsis lyrata subsp. lyrata TaxID=81972 RepID=UPI000A29BD4B
MNREKNLDSIPIDLFLEIFSRLPTYSVGRSRCVSKQWASILGRQNFTELFLTKSSTRPRLLFALQPYHGGEWLLYSLLQPQNPYEKSIEGDDAAPVICNPSTGHYSILPKLRMDKKTRSFLGFDPIEKQFKVLFMMGIVGSERVNLIMTLGTGKLRYEKSKFLDSVCLFDQLINYKGKLGGFYLNYASSDGFPLKLTMWILEDVEKQEWSKYVYTVWDESKTVK